MFAWLSTVDFVNTLELPFRVGDLDLPERRERVYRHPVGGSRCSDVPVWQSNTVEGRTHIVAKGGWGCGKRRDEEKWTDVTWRSLVH